MLAARSPSLTFASSSPYTSPAAGQFQRKNKSVQNGRREIWSPNFWLLTHNFDLNISLFIFHLPQQLQNICVLYLSEKKMEMSFTSFLHPQNFSTHPHSHIVEVKNINCQWHTLQDHEESRHRRPSQGQHSSPPSASRTPCCRTASFTWARKSSPKRTNIKLELKLNHFWNRLLVRGS